MISIIVPVYNKANVLRYCLDSIQNQSYFDFEVIIVDDGSKDGSDKICLEYVENDSRFKYFVKENNGVSAARNYGFEKATGEYIMCVDSDDYICKDYLYEFIEAIKLYPDCENIWCGYQGVRDYDSSIINISLADNKNKYSVFDKAQIMTLHSLNMDAVPWNKLYRADIIKSNNLKMREGLSLGEDLIFNFEYLDCTNSKIIIINKPLYNYYSSDNESLSKRYYDDMLSIYHQINSVMEKYLILWNCDNNEKIKYYNAVLMKLEAIMDNTFSKQNKASYLTKIKYNNAILKSAEFKEAFEISDYYLNILFKLAYKSKNYIFVNIAKGIFSITDKLKGRK